MRFPIHPFPTARRPWPTRFVAHLACAVLLALAACAPASPRPDVADTRSSAPARRAEPAAPAVEPVDYVEIVTGGAAADAQLPLVVAIHGLGDRPEIFATFFDAFDTPARIVLPRATMPWGDGFAWFPFRTRDNDIPHLAEGVAAASDRVAATITAVSRSRPTRGKAIVTGFSQGGMISFAVATRHSDVVAAAVPVSGFLPEPLFPTDRGRIPPILAFHGDADTVVPIALDRAGVARLVSLGVDVRLVEFPGVGHVIPDPMRDALFAALAEKIAASAAPTP